VYRTYLAPGQPVSAADRDAIERAIAAAKRRNPAIEESIFNFLRDILLFRFPENLDVESRAAHMQFVLKFQQYTAPIMAKGLEDTVFYIFNRLAGLNEVGGEPQQFGIGIAAFHQRNQNRLRDWPASLLATSTHDTKRSEDVRARMVAISEIPDLWRRSLQRWRMINRRWKKRIEDVDAPDANEEYLLYQTLLGTWPVNIKSEAERNADSKYVERIQAYMTKALNEAKLNTSWVQPNEQWLAAMHEFIAKILETSARNKFLPSFYPVVEEVARLGAINSLAQVLLKLTSPGVPDIYQGNEIWNFLLVDPDNRWPIDYKLRREMLSFLTSSTPEELMQNWPDGRIKMFLTQRLLHFRNKHPDLFRHGNYLPLAGSGILDECCVSFARELDRQWILVIAPRLASRVGFPPVGERWQDTAIELPKDFGLENARDILSNRQAHIRDRQLLLADALSALPFAAITNCSSGPLPSH
jgi:(1->4)-alpha-D-glucan 1-alpha-D-glucosylmutase